MIDKNLLPPKKIIGKNSKSLVEKRQKELEVYLQTLLAKFPTATPKVLSCFLHFHLYEINGITAQLSEELFHRGEQLLLAGEVFNIRPLQLYAITQQLRKGKPTCVNGDAKTDLGHILDFTCRLKYLKISGTRGPVGTSNIQEHFLPFDLSVFKSLQQIEINDCEAKHIQGLTSSKPTLATMSIQFSAASMKDILVPEASEFDHWEPECPVLECPVTAIVPTWKNLTTLDMSHNWISNIDDSVKLIRKIEFLDLSHNEISTVENLQHLYNLVHLDLSYNKLASLEGIHVKLGNIKTLNLAGNLLESLCGLNKLYSLVNLDLSNNKIEQIEEIKNIGRLPCLEKLALSSNPLTIIPDYRTKVLAIFGDRASEVCLDNTVTTEKELDTVEVLKAIEKAKEAKNKANNANKKLSEDSATSSSSSLNARSSSPSLPRPISSSQEIVCIEAAIVSSLSSPSSLIPTDPTATLRCSEETDSGSGGEGQTSTSDIDGHTGDLSTSSECSQENPCPQNTIILPFSCVSYTATNQDFIHHLSNSIAQALRRPPHSFTDGEYEGSLTSGPRVTELEDGYFEMGLHKGEQPEWNVASDVAQTVARSPGDQVHIVKVLWSFSIHIYKGIHQFASCLVLTDDVLAVFEIPKHESQDNHLPNLSAVKLALCFPYTDLAEFGFLVPEMCLTLKTRCLVSCLFVLSEPQNLQDFYYSLQMLVSQACTSMPPGIMPYSVKMSLQEFVFQLEGFHHVASNDAEIKGCFPVCLFQSNPNDLQSQSATARTVWAKNAWFYTLYSTVYDSTKGSPYILLPCWIFFTSQYLYVLKANFHVLFDKSLDSEGVLNAFSLNRIPLALVLLRPFHSSAQKKGSFSDGHILQLLIGYRFVTAVFLLPHEKFHFLKVYSLLRTFLQDVKTIIIFKGSKSPDTVQNHLPDTSNRQAQATSFYKPRLTLSAMYPSEFLLQKLTEENQIPLYLSVSSSLLYVAGLKGSTIVEFFHSNVAEVENEELRHLMWSSVVFYKTPDVEVTVCVLLSTKAVYFLLDDSAVPSNEHHQQDFWNQKPSSFESSSFCLSYCLVLKLNDLQSVNIGLFDQYFRIAGPSADHVVTCLTRDSYSTHAFIQHLMTVLSLLARAPSPEPAEKDFYSEFGRKTTGKMENYEMIHSSRVKFIYPNEEEIGDLTFVVTEKMANLSNMQSLNILLYVLAFQVNTIDGTPQGSTSLQSKTLILTSSALFLFSEDYISYPLPDFAKEPPKKDKYQLTDGRRIRDLDRVLMGYQPYPQALTFVFDDVQNEDLMQNLTLDHFGETLNSPKRDTRRDNEVQWYIFIPSADCRERLISLLARQWEILCGRELPLELTG
nr:nischarin isoform X3 [Geotrypetes seraphini]